MKTQLLVLLLGLPAILFFSCTVEKRVHMPGYHVEWKNRQLAPQQEESAQALRPAEQSVPQPVPETIGNTTAVAEPVPAETIASVEETPGPEIPVIRDQQTNHRTLRLKLPLPKTERTLRQANADRSTVGQADSGSRAGLLLAPIKLLFTILLIALVIVGVVLLFVLESALGGTALLAAGAVLLILILL